MEKKEDKIKLEESKLAKVPFMITTKLNFKQTTTRELGNLNELNNKLE